MILSLFNKVITFNKLIYFFFFFLFTNTTLSWERFECDQLHILSYDSNEFASYECMKNNIQGIVGEYIQLINLDYTGEMLFITNEYLIDPNSRWGSDYSYQYLKRDLLEDRIYSWGFGNSILSVDDSIQEIKFRKHKFYLKKFKTDLGIGFMATGQMLNHSWEFIYFNEESDLVITSDLIENALSPMKIRGLF